MLRIIISTLLVSISAVAALPTCYDDGEPMAFNNAEVLQWKKTTREQYHDRAFVQGPVVKIYPGRNGHTHFSIRIGQADQTIEVIYNDEFGRLPEITPGKFVQACGDYITSRVAGKYPASPDGALVHWVHRNPSRHGHEDGFVVVDGKVYGNGSDSRRHSEDGSPVFGVAQ